MHIPVMINEVMEYLKPKDGEVYVDCTFGRGGYTRKMLGAANVDVFSIDCDPDAKEFVERFAQELPRKEKFHFVEGNFGDIKLLLKKHAVEKVDAIVLDLGISSVQVDDGSRGFSFSKEAKLDMRMSKKGYSAYDFINESDERTIADIIYKYGEEHKAFRIAKKIVEARKEGPITTTTELADIVRSVFPKKHTKIDSATKTFQAIRIHVNDELKSLESVLEASEDLLKDGGRLIVVSFHSLEDSIVKQFLKKRAKKDSSGSRYLPSDTDEEFVPTFSYLSRKAVKPSRDEVLSNARSRSARLRAAMRVNGGNYHA